MIIFSIIINYISSHFNINNGEMEKTSNIDKTFYVFGIYYLNNDCQNSYKLYNHKNYFGKERKIATQ